LIARVLDGNSLLRGDGYGSFGFVGFNANSKLLALFAVNTGKKRRPQQRIRAAAHRLGP
jgi:hypothetical protein